jgi:hypothetical protein
VTKKSDREKLAVDPSSSEYMSDAQLSSAADRIRRLSPGIESPNDEAGQLAPFNEEAVRRAHRIVELGTGFWQQLLRIDRGFHSNETSDTSAQGCLRARGLMDRSQGGTEVNQAVERDPAWINGRILGAMIRAWGDLKNSRRALLWFDSSPLLGPPKTDVVFKDDLDPALNCLLTERALREVAAVLSKGLKVENNEAFRKTLRIGISSGALEREVRNPQATVDALRRSRKRPAIAFVGDRGYAGKENATKALLASRGTNETDWGPLYSFLRRGDVLVVSLPQQADQGEGWVAALAIVTAAPVWDGSQWTGAIGCVLPFFNEHDPAGSSRFVDDKRLETAFRYPHVDSEKRARAFEPIAEAFGLIKGPPSTEAIELKRLDLFELRDNRDNDLDGDRSRSPWKITDRIPIGAPAPWRRLDQVDLRATLGEFWEPLAVALVSPSPSAVDFASVGASSAQHRWFDSNLDLERFALSSANVRLGVRLHEGHADSKVASLGRIAPRGSDDSMEAPEELVRALDGYKRNQGPNASISNLVAAVLPKYSAPTEEKLAVTLWPNKSEDGMRGDRDEEEKAFVEAIEGRAEDGPVTCCALYLDSDRAYLDSAIARLNPKRMEVTHGRVAIDPAGTLIRDCRLISGKDERKPFNLLIVLGDDSTATVDLGAIVWLLVSHGSRLRKDHVLDLGANTRHHRNSGLSESEAHAASRELLADSWRMIKPCRLDFEP